MFTPLLLVPPITFLIVMVIVLLQLYTFSKLSYKSKTVAPGKTKCYACGEDVPAPHIQPEYGQFFSFAFFFTIMHVVALVLATLPPGRGNLNVVLVDVLYIIGAVVALAILYRR